MRIPLCHVWLVLCPSSSLDFILDFIKVPLVGPMCVPPLHRGVIFSCDPLVMDRAVPVGMEKRAQGR